MRTTLNRKYKGENNPNYKGGPVELICNVCGKSFLKSRGAYNLALKRNKSNTFSCSKECANKNKNHIQWKDSRVNMICEHCGEKYKMYESQRRHKHSFCSKKCAMKFNGLQRVVDRLESICLNCGETFLRTKRNLSVSKNHFCCNKCQYEYSIGANAPVWRGGISPFTVRVRALYKYISWRKQVLERDNYTCVECGCTTNLDTHHIIELKKKMNEYGIDTVDKAKDCEALWDINNGMTLCLHCHADKHPDQRAWLLTNNRRGL